MKKALFTLLTFLTVLILSTVIFDPTSVEAAEFTEGYYTYTVSDGKATITEVDTSISGDIEIPATLGGYPVTSIGDGTFIECPLLTSITIPDGVTRIGYWAFSGCSSLTSIHISESVAFIGYDNGNSLPAFRNCSSLTSITVASGNSTYYSQDNCLIRKNYWDRGIDLLVLGCQTSVIPDNIECISTYAFYGCTELKSIHIPASVCYEISPYTFAYCSNLESITVSPGNPRYSSEGNCLLSGSSILRGCKTSVIPNTVTRIGEYAFSGCSSLTNITIPDIVTRIGECAFSGCSSLTSIKIPANVTSLIGSTSTFEGCENLKTVFIHSPDIAQDLIRDTSCGHLGYYADTIYVASNIVTVGNHIATMPYKTEGVTVNGAKYTSYSKVSNHTCSYEWVFNSSKHWQICDGCDYVGTKTAHVFDNDSDATCNTCGYIRQVQTTTTKPATTKPSSTMPETTKPSTTKPSTTTAPTTTPNATNPPASSTTNVDTTVENTTVDTTLDETTVVDDTTTLDETTEGMETTAPDTTTPDVTIPDTTDGGKGRGKKDNNNTTTVIIIVAASALVLGGIGTAVTLILKKKK